MSVFACVRVCASSSAHVLVPALHSGNSAMWPCACSCAFAMAIARGVCTYICMHIYHDGSCNEAERPQKNSPTACAQMKAQTRIHDHTYMRTCTCIYVCTDVKCTFTSVHLPIIITYVHVDTRTALHTYVHVDTRTALQNPSSARTASHHISVSHASGVLS